MVETTSYHMQCRELGAEVTPFADGWHDWGFPRASETEARQIIARDRVHETGYEWRVVKVTERREILGEGRCEKRYLAADEIRLLANEAACLDGGTALRAHLMARGNHPPANGQCFEVSLTRAEALLIDELCVELQIGGN